MRRKATMTVQTINEIFPAFAAELESLTKEAGRPISLGRYEPTGSYGPGHVNVVLPSARGLIVYDVVNASIAAIEVLDRPDVKEALDRYVGAEGHSR